MRYFSYNVYDPDHPDMDNIQTKSEQEILDEYWPYWYDKMCKKFGKALIDNNYGTDDCIDDWTVVNWAWEVKDVCLDSK